MIGQESGQLGAPDRAAWRTLTLIRLGKRRTAPTASPSGGRPVTGQPMEPSHARVRVPPGDAHQERRAASRASPRAEPAYGQGAAERLQLLPRARRGEGGRAGQGQKRKRGYVRWPESGKAQATQASQDSDA